ncbi:Nucleosome assembly protein 1;2, partial [Mucuna pruriens]
MEQDYDIGSTIRDKIIPHGVSWFTEEAIQADEFGELVEEDDEDFRRLRARLETSTNTNIQPKVSTHTDTHPMIISKAKLSKATYGLKQAPYAWFEKLKSTFLSLGFQDNKVIPLSVYNKRSSIVYLSVSVDNIIITVSFAHLVQQLTTKLDVVFSLKQLGSLDYFLSIEVQPQSNGLLLLSQTKCIKDLLFCTNTLDV